MEGRGETCLSFLITQFAIHYTAQETRPARFCQHPRAKNQRGIMAHMLPVITGQNGSPITHLILLKANNLLFHRGLNADWLLIT